MVYGFVKQSGGGIAVRSAPGAGTTFAIYLAAEASEAQADVVRRAVSSRPEGTETVLVVEDEEAVRNLARRILSAAGYTVLTAANGGEALLLCERRGRDVDLLLTDVVMPGLDGRALAERLAPLCPGTRVLYMSGYTDDVIAHRGVIDAGTHFIAKPFTVDGLTRAVRSALDDR
jgi:CheY-like chemotaxis protein